MNASVINVATDVFPGLVASQDPGPYDSPDLRRLLSAPRLALGQWPTPVEDIAVAPGRTIMVKRDDLSGFGRGGAKARKLEHLLGYLLSRSHTELITLAGNVTNLAFDFMPAVDRSKLRLRLLILDDPQIAAASREKVFEGIRDRVELIGESSLSAAWAGLKAYVSARRRGEKPFLLLPGVSHPSGVVGNACGFVEMVTQLHRAGRTLPGTVFVTAATGTTVAGFLIAAEVLRAAGAPPIRVVGVQIYPGSIRQWTWALMRWTERKLGLQARVPSDALDIEQESLFGGFGRFPPELGTMCEQIQAAHGLQLDPIFGGKTWRSMLGLVDEGRVKGPVLYWHCGYTPEWRMLARVVGSP